MLYASKAGEEATFHATLRKGQEQDQNCSRLRFSEVSVGTSGDLALSGLMWLFVASTAPAVWPGRNRATGHGERGAPSARGRHRCLGPGLGWGRVRISI